jgi:hypothetical protein
MFHVPTFQFFSLQDDLEGTGDSAGGTDLFAQIIAACSLSAHTNAGACFRAIEYRPPFSQLHGMAGADLHAQTAEITKSLVNLGLGPVRIHPHLLLTDGCLLLHQGSHLSISKVAFLWQPFSSQE